MPSKDLEQDLTQSPNSGDHNRAQSCTCHSDRDAVPLNFAGRLREIALRNLDAIAADLDDLSSEPEACERRARALATVTLALDEIARAQKPRPQEPLLYDEGDPRACPREPEQFRSALANALDRLGDKKNISVN